MKRDQSVRQPIRWRAHCLLSVRHICSGWIFHTLVLRSYPVLQLPSQIRRANNLCITDYLITSKGFERCLTLTSRSLGIDPQQSCLLMIKDYIYWRQGNRPDESSTVLVSAENLILIQACHLLFQRQNQV